MRTTSKNTTLEPCSKAKHHRTQPRHRQRGFTLIEIILVLSIIALLVGAGIMHLSGTTDSAKIIRVRSDFSTLCAALNLYQMNAGRYPTTEQGLRALYKKPTTSPVPRGYRSQLRKQLRDPWGSHYGYIYPSKKGGDLPDIYSVGPDAREGTGDEIYMFDEEEGDDE